MFNVEFWKDAGERALKTAVQAFIAVLTATGATGILDAPFGVAFSSAGLALLLSIGTSIASIGAADQGTASLVKASSGEDYEPQHLRED